jgi:hypothetical protein
MKITKDVINDLLPLYFSKEGSPDTRKLVEEYLVSHPNFEKEVKEYTRNPLPDSQLQTPGGNEEMKALRKTRLLLKMRSYLMGFAIFCSLVPFSFIYTKGTFHWLFRESPISALVYAIFGVAFWIGYIILKRKSGDL